MNLSKVALIGKLSKQLNKALKTNVNDSVDSLDIDDIWLLIGEMSSAYTQERPAIWYKLNGLSEGDVGVGFIPTDADLSRNMKPYNDVDSPDTSLSRVLYRYGSDLFGKLYVQQKGVVHGTNSYRTFIISLVL